MEKERVNRGETYWYIDEGCDVYDCTEMNAADDSISYRVGNYFSTKEEAEAMASKLRAVLNGADVIEMPSDEDISKKNDSSAHEMDIDDGETLNAGLYWRGWWDAVRWLKSKIVK